LAVPVRIYIKKLEFFIARKMRRSRMIGLITKIVIHTIAAYPTAPLIGPVLRVESRAKKSVMKPRTTTDHNKLTHFIMVD